MTAEEKASLNGVLDRIEDLIAHIRQDQLATKQADAPIEPAPTPTPPAPKAEGRTRAARVAVGVGLFILGTMGGWLAHRFIDRDRG